MFFYKWGKIVGKLCFTHLRYMRVILLKIIKEYYHIKYTLESGYSNIITRRFLDMNEMRILG